MTTQNAPSPQRPQRVYKDEEDIRKLAKQALIACAIYARDAVFAWLDDRPISRKQGDGHYTPDQKGHITNAMDMAMLTAKAFTTILAAWFTVEDTKNSDLLQAKSRRR